MKLSIKKIKLLLISCFALVAVAFGAMAFSMSHANVKAAGTKLTSGEYLTDGSSIRLFRTAEDVEVSDKKGLRFHVEMGENFSYGGTPIINVNATNEQNGSFVINEGFKTYTLILPTRLLSGELTINTDKVMKLETSNYWYKDKDGNLESVAYVYNIPSHRYTDNFSFRGIICDADGNVIAQTPVSERCVAEIARKSYDATVSGEEVWGNETRTEKAKEALRSFIPAYEVIYQTADGTTLASENLLWGDTLQNAPNGAFNAWYSTTTSEEVDLSQPAKFGASGVIKLTASKAVEFTLTGVAAEASFETDGQIYSGVKIYATLHKDAFANKTPLDAHAVEVEHRRGETVINSNFTLNGVWTMEDSGHMRLFFAFDSSILNSGDQIVLKGSSVFYANGTMYQLTEDYYIDYTKVNATESYGMFLGHLYNSDVKSITNCSEDSTGNNGEPNDFTIRAELYEDVMVNGEFTFEFGSDVDKTKYPYPVFIKCGQDPTKLIPVSGGRYYWNEGNHKILELIGAGEYENKVFGWHNGDQLIGAPGTIIKQNGGYYIFEDEMYAYFLLNGNKDQFGIALGDWVVGDEKGEFTTSEFATEGSVTETTDYGSLADEIRINTTNHWFGQVKVNLLTVEKMDNDSPYAVYVTSKDGTVTEIDKIRYHGQANPDGGNYQILGLCGDGKFTVGDVVTIVEGTRFWLGSEYYTVTEEITYYYNGNYWVQNYDESTMGELSSANFGDRAHNQGATETRMYFTAPLAGYTTTDGGAFDELRIGTGSIKFNGNPITYLRYQRWDAGSTWLSFGGYIGSVAFGDRIVIEKGTTIWSDNNVGYRFTERVEWIYAGPNSANSSITWSPIHNGVTIQTNVSNAVLSGVGTLAVGSDYTITVTPSYNYLVSDVIINGTSYGVTANGKYTFRVAAENNIVVNTTVGYKATFSVPSNVTVDGGSITNGTIKVISSGDSLTFSAVAQEGYKISSVTGAKDNGDGTYTISNLTANVTISFNVVKLYKVTYTYSNASVTADVENGAWVDNGTQITLTVNANNGYSVLGVTNAVKVSKNTYIATVNGKDLNVQIQTLATNNFIDVTETIGIENRTSWASGGHADIITLGLLLNGAYFKSFVPTGDNATCWYQGNTTAIEQNNNVDIMEYIYINGLCARDLLIANQTAQQKTANTGTWLSNPAAWPIAIETNGDVWIRFDETKFGNDGTYTFTLKAGFVLKDSEGKLNAVTKDVNFTYTNGTISKAIDYSGVELVDVTFNVGAGALINGTNTSKVTLESGTPYTFTVSTAEGYRLIEVVGATNNGDGTYTITPTENSTVNVSTQRVYKVTYAGEGFTIDGNVANGEWVEDGTVVEFTATANSGYTIIEVLGVEKLNPNTYTATVDGENLVINVVTFKNGDFVDISDRLQIEDRSWGAHTGEVYVAMLDTGITNANGTNYLNTSVNDTWHVGNTAIKEANGGVDIMEYIYVNGVSARSLITANANGRNDCNNDGIYGYNEETGNGDCWLSNSAAYPVYVESTNGSGLMMRFATAKFGTKFTITIKSGFRITNSNGDLVVVTKDIDFIYDNKAITKQDYWMSVAIRNIKSNVSTYTDGALYYSENLDALKSVENVSTVTFNAEMFDMLNYYGYTTMNCDLVVRANRMTTTAYEWKILKDGEQILYVDNNENYDKAVATSADNEVTYETYYRTSSFTDWKLDEESIWTVSNITLS